jgi:hypothetical protein
VSARLKRYPEYASFSPPAADYAAALRMAPRPPADTVALLRIAPEIISVVDYSPGFGHSNLITFSDRDLDFPIDSLRHQWVDISISEKPLSENKSRKDK